MKSRGTFFRHFWLTALVLAIPHYIYARPAAGTSLEDDYQRPNWAQAFKDMEGDPVNPYRPEERPLDFIWDQEYIRTAIATLDKSDSKYHERLGYLSRLTDDPENAFFFQGLQGEIHYTRSAVYMFMEEMFMDEDRRRQITGMVQAIEDERVEELRAEVGAKFDSGELDGFIRMQGFLPSMPDFSPKPVEVPPAEEESGSALLDFFSGSDDSNDTLEDNNEGSGFWKQGSSRSFSDMFSLPTIDEGFEPIPLVTRMLLDREAIVDRYIELTHPTFREDLLPEMRDEFARLTLDFYESNYEVGLRNLMWHLIYFNSISYDMQYHFFQNHGDGYEARIPDRREDKVKTAWNNDKRARLAEEVKQIQLDDLEARIAYHYDLRAFEGSAGTVERPLDADYLLDVVLDTEWDTHNRWYQDAVFRKSFEETITSTRPVAEKDPMGLFSPYQSPPRDFLRRSNGPSENRYEFWVRFLGPRVDWRSADAEGRRKIVLDYWVEASEEQRDVVVSEWTQMYGQQYYLSDLLFWFYFEFRGVILAPVDAPQTHLDYLKLPHEHNRHWIDALIRLGQKDIERAARGADERALRGFMKQAWKSMQRSERIAVVVDYFADFTRREPWLSSITYEKYRNYEHPNLSALERLAQAKHWEDLYRNVYYYDRGTGRGGLYPIDSRIHAVDIHDRYNLASLFRRKQIAYSYIYVDDHLTQDARGRDILKLTEHIPTREEIGQAVMSGWEADERRFREEFPSSTEFETIMDSDEVPEDAISRRPFTDEEIAELIDSETTEEDLRQKEFVILPLTVERREKFFARRTGYLMDNPSVMELVDLGEVHMKRWFYTIPPDRELPDELIEPAVQRSVEVAQATLTTTYPDGSNWVLPANTPILELDEFWSEDGVKREKFKEKSGYYPLRRSLFEEFVSGLNLYWGMDGGALAAVSLFLGFDLLKEDRDEWFATYDVRAMHYYASGRLNPAASNFETFLNGKIDFPPFAPVIGLAPEHYEAWIDFLLAYAAHDPETGPFASDHEFGDYFQMLAGENGPLIESAREYLRAKEAGEEFLYTDSLEIEWLNDIAELNELKGQAAKQRAAAETAEAESSEEESVDSASPEGAEGEEIAEDSKPKPNVVESRSKFYHFMKMSFMNSRVNRAYFEVLRAIAIAKSMNLAEIQIERDRKEIQANQAGENARYGTRDYIKYTMAEIFKTHPEINTVENLEALRTALIEVFEATLAQCTAEDFRESDVPFYIHIYRTFDRNRVAIINEGIGNSESRTTSRVEILNAYSGTPLEKVAKLMGGLAIFVTEDALKKSALNFAKEQIDLMIDENDLRKDEELAFEDSETEEINGFRIGFRTARDKAGKYHWLEFPFVEGGGERLDYDEATEFLSENLEGAVERLEGEVLFEDGSPSLPSRVPLTQRSFTDYLGRFYKPSDTFYDRDLIGRFYYDGMTYRGQVGVMITVATDMTEDSIIPRVGHPLSAEIVRDREAMYEAERRMAGEEDLRRMLIDSSFKRATRNRVTVGGVETSLLERPHEPDYFNIRINLDDGNGILGMRETSRGEHEDLRHPMPPIERNFPAWTLKMMESLAYNSMPSGRTAHDMVDFLLEKGKWEPRRLARRRAAEAKRELKLAQAEAKAAAEAAENAESEGEGEDSSGIERNVFDDHNRGRALLPEVTPEDLENQEPPEPRSFLERMFDGSNTRNPDPNSDPFRDN